MNAMPARKGRTGPIARRWTLAAVIASTVAVILFSVASWRYYGDLRDQRIAAAVTESQRVLVAFEDHAARLFDYSDGYLRSIRAFYLRHGSGEVLRQYISEVAVSRGDRFSGSLIIIDAAGKVVFSSEHTELPDISAADLEYFQVLRDASGDAMFLDPTRKGRVTGQYQFRLTRGIYHEGTFRGVVVLTLRPESLANFFTAFDLGQHSVLVMVKLDHRFIVRQPLPSHEIYGGFLEAATLWERLKDSPTGSFRLVSVTDGTVRYYSYRQLPSHPVVITVGVAEEDILNDLLWARRTIIIQTLAFDIGAVVFCLLLLLILHKNRTLHREEEVLRAESAKLARANVALAQSNADLERFAYVASHDLQTPLRTITSFAQMLERRYRGRLDSDAAEFIGFIVDGAKHMSALISDLLEYARISGQANGLEAVPAAKALDDALTRLAGPIAECGARVMADTLPVVVADRALLASLFQNLIDNALKYRDPRRAPEIGVSAERASATMWRIAVRDNGVGIEEQYFTKIFEVFQRLQPGGAVSGTGIGLAICQRIVSRLGGEIGVESVPGEGSTFFFTLPDAT